MKTRNKKSIILNFARGALVVISAKDPFGVWNTLRWLKLCCWGVPPPFPPHPTPPPRPRGNDDIQLRDSKRHVTPSGTQSLWLVRAAVPLRRINMHLIATFWTLVTIGPGDHTRTKNTNRSIQQCRKGV